MFAVALEADSMHAFRARLCFLQIGTDQDIWLLDTLSPGVRASVMAELLGDPGPPKGVLADMVAERLGVALDKAHQQSDFSLRPLPPEMRRYIADDVRYLTELGRLVSAAVVAADSVAQVQLDCATL